MLLVQHQDDDSFGGEPWWVTPGGGVEGEESLTECARRETLEETGLSVELGRIAYVAVFVEPGWYHCEVYFVADSYSGTLVQRSEARTPASSTSTTSSRTFGSFHGTRWPG